MSAMSSDSFPGPNVDNILPRPIQAQKRSCCFNVSGQVSHPNVQKFPWFLLDPYSKGTFNTLPLAAQDGSFSWELHPLRFLSSSNEDLYRTGQSYTMTF